MGPGAEAGPVSTVPETACQKSENIVLWLFLASGHPISLYKMLALRRAPATAARCAVRLARTTPVAAAVASTSRAASTASAAAATTSRRSYATHSPAQTAGANASNPVLPSLNNFTEEEDLLRETARKFSEEVVAPRVREMDESEKMDPEIIKGLFENGVWPIDFSCHVTLRAENILCLKFMGIETSADHGGAECGFTSAIIVIEGERSQSSDQTSSAIRADPPPASYRARKGRSVCVCDVRRSQHAGQHYSSSLR